MNRRNQIAMTAEEQSAYLAAAKTLILTSIDGQGYPHAVAMWFALIDGLVHMTSFAKAQKIVNMRRNPKVSLLAESGAVYSELRGLLIRGEAEVIEDTELCLTILGNVQPRYFGPMSPSAREALRKQASKRVAIRIHPVRVSSWDHTKLGGVY